MYIYTSISVPRKNPYEYRGGEGYLEEDKGETDDTEAKRRKRKKDQIFSWRWKQ